MEVESLANWLSIRDSDTFPYPAVIDEYLRVGKHFVPTELLDMLANIRSTISDVRGSSASVRLLQRFLDAALDKRDGRYDYPSYLALGLLPLPTLDESYADLSAAERQYDRIFVHLIADLVRFELDAACARTNLLPEMRPDLATTIKRCRLGLIAARSATTRLGLMPEAVGDLLLEAREFCSNIDATLSRQERDTLRLSMLPVYIIHDEHMFIRVLQAFEATFAVLAVQLSDAISALAAGRSDLALARIQAAQKVLHDAAPLFSLLGTMQVEAFRTFRTYTEGASAIQSRNYKLVESVCRQPDPERVDSIAYHSVPEVRERVLAGPPTLNGEFETARAGGRLNAADARVLELAMRQLASTLLQWRRTHYRLAVRMLGERSGTGYTQGTPYLKAVQTIPVFPVTTPCPSGPGES